MSKFTDVMLDIETVGTTPGCAIIQIAAVPFNIETGEISDNVFNMSINLEEQLVNGYTSNQNTLDWWNKTNPELFKTLSKSENSFKTVMKEFEKWFSNLDAFYSIRTWGNSVRFDLGLLEGWYSKHQSNGLYKSFWNNWLERDCRTLFNLDDRNRRDLKFEGIPHNAIDDCKHQIKCLRYIKEKFNLTIG